LKKSAQFFFCMAPDGRCYSCTQFSFALMAMFKSNDSLQLA